MNQFIKLTKKAFLATLLVSTSGIVHSQVALQCANTNALPLPLEITLNEIEKTGSVKMQYSKQTKCEFLGENWVYAPDEIRFEFSIDLDDCGKHLTPLKAKLDRKAGVLFLAQANGSGDVVNLNCARVATGNKF
ncbi:MAG: hypothetical protein ACKO0Z_08830 [Betaproteobacteria bacterium]